MTDIQSYSQSGTTYELVTDRDDKKRLLAAAANDEIVLYALLMPHTAELKAHHWVEAPKKANRMIAASLVPLRSQQVAELIGVQRVTVKSYPATDPSNEKHHPWDDHFFLLDEPQEISLTQVYCKADSLKSEDDGSELKGTETACRDYDQEIADLFDPVSVEALNAMFPSEDGMWARAHRKSKEFGLIIARNGRGKYNPYLAARWWLGKHKPKGWDWARCARKLASNLPARSKGCEHMLTGYRE